MNNFTGINIAKILNESINIETMRECICECGMAYDVMGIAISNLILALLLFVFFDRRFKDFHQKKLNILKFGRMAHEDKCAYIMDRLIVTIFILNLITVIYNIVNSLSLF